MKIDLSTIDKNQFNVQERILNGELVYLVGPNPKGVEWTQANKIFRSSVWSMDGELISAGLPKFMNFGEKPTEFPTPTDLNGATLVEKIDGSLLIVSKYKGNYILRTRGTVDATELENGYELETFKSQYPLVFQIPFDKSSWESNKEKYPALYQFPIYDDTWPFSLLFEWVSPTQRIVVQHEKPDWFLVGGVYHNNYTLWRQDWLEALAKFFGCPRPSTYTFTTISDLIDNVEKWEGKEGVCIYSGHDQVIHKIKSDWYLIRHHMRSEMSTIDKVLDYWFDEGRPAYQEFYAKLSTFDYEVAERSRGFMSRICDADKEVKELIEGMKRFIETQLKPLPLRRLQATVVFQSYGKTERANCVFSLLDGKEINDKQYIKLMYQMLKKA